MAERAAPRGGSVSHSTLQRFGDETCSPRARGSGVWGSRDPQAATGGQAAAATHTPGRQPATTPFQPDRIQVRPSLAAEGGTSTAHSGRHARNRGPGLRRAGPQGHGGVSVAVPESSQPDPRSHHDGPQAQRCDTRSRCR